MIHKDGASLAEKMITGRVLVNQQGNVIIRLRSRIAELERERDGLRRELSRLGLPEITAAWE